jgi:glucosylglycerate phosphorylase
MTPSEQKLQALLTELYPDDAATVHQQIMERLKNTRVPQASDDYFSEKTVTLITYGDSLKREGELPLQTLRAFLDDWFDNIIDTVHILPFYPYSSDDGFSVIDYMKINPELGTWEDVRALSEKYRLMFDAVVNHMSAQSEWFQKFLSGEYPNLFMTESPDTDLSMVTRPRTSPLLTPFQRPDGSTVYVWTTFSADQVDLDFRSPETLLKILDVLLFYVEQGAQVIRLDAIAFLWKIAGTTSLHLPQTHTVVKLFRAALDIIAPHVVLITETNVPHAENISYFGDGTDEAQLVYNFTLPPLLLHALIRGDASKLAEWVNTLQTPSRRTSYFNFTASHDGIGVRPVEGILTADELAELIAHVEANGGRVSYRSNPDGTQSPYELNITYVDATGAPDLPTELHIARFLLTQAVMLSLAGVPAIYIHSLLGTRNDTEGLQRLGYNRAINRAKLHADTVRDELNTPFSFRARVFEGCAHLLNVRTHLKPFHPHASQLAFVLHRGTVFGIERALDEERLTALFNFTDEPQTALIDTDCADALSGENIRMGEVTLAPYEVRWLMSDSKH